MNRQRSEIRRKPCFACLALYLLCVMPIAGRADAETGLKLLPEAVTLTGKRASQRLLAEAVRGGQFAGDRTAQAVFASSNPKVAKVGKDGVARPVGDGEATITVTAGGRRASATVQVRGTRQVTAWSFRNHVLPVLTKASCNSGACHGAAAGKGGLKLTLRGYDPDADYNVLTRQAKGRRIVKNDPARSLLLLKPTMKIAHGGGPRLAANSPEAAILGDWIRSGAARPSPDDPQLKTLEVFPNVAVLRPGDTQQIVVRARYSDGREEDVTRQVKFGTSENAVATVDDDGKVKVAGSGEAAITVWFSSRVTFARIVSPYPNAPTPETFAQAAKHNFLDGLVLKKLEALGVAPSPLCSDSEFVRRATLDTAGILPTPQETEAFLKDTAPDKRARLIESLLSRPEFTDYWAYKWSDLLLVSSRRLSGGAMTAFYNYIRQSVAENKPWDKFVREIVTAQGSTLENGAANFFALHKEPIALTETVSQAFLGMSLTCARCHNHPMEKWTQNEYYQMANLLSRVRLKNGDRGGEVLVLTDATGAINHPRLGRPLPPKPLDGQEVPLNDPRDRRQLLADWLTAPENPYFSRALVNRVWGSLMGRGLVEAEDDLRLTNPASNAELLDALAADFSGNGYDVKRLIRLILNSAAYQRSATPTGNNAQDDRFYSRYIVRRLPAEVMLDALSQVTGTPTEFPGYPKGQRALQLPDSLVASSFLSTFGRPERVQTCSCERTEEPSIAQALHLVNGDTVNQKLRAPGNALDRLLDAGSSEEEALNRLYLAALCRAPSEAERGKALTVLAESRPPAGMPEAEKRKLRRAVLEDLFWAVLTDREFLFNH